MNYRSVADLNRQLVHSLGTLPPDLDLIVGIPRSGLLPANLLSLHLNVPMTDVEGLLAGRVMRTGARYGAGSTTDFLDRKRNVLVVDDSVCSGQQMREVQQQLARARLPHRIRYGAVYVGSDAYEDGVVDWFAELLPMPRVFEWNLMHNHPVLSRSCMAIEGVLCREALEHEHDDGKLYRNYLETVEPSYLPTRRVGWLVTGRPERYRESTEAWLARHGIEYGHLIMMQQPAADTTERACAGFRAETYLRTGAVLFIEGSAARAAEIAGLAGKPVFCMETWDMHYPGGSTQRAQLTAAAATLGFNPVDHLVRRTTAFLRRLAKRTRKFASRRRLRDAGALPVSTRRAEPGRAEAARAVSAAGPGAGSTGAPRPYLAADGTRMEVESAAGAPTPGA